MPKDLEIVRGRFVGESHPCFIVAEIGQNHQGDIEIAKQLIRVAKECGAECVKFQKSCLKEKFTKSALSRKYESPHSWGKTYGEHKEHLEFNLQQMQELQDYAENIINIPFTASAMDKVSADELDHLNVPFIKIGSGDTDNFPLLEHVAKMRRTIVYSTGMQDMDVVQEGYQRITSYHSALVILQCTSAYPTPPCETNLRVMQSYVSAFPKAHIGFSSHEDGMSISLAAVALGARVLERHITLCRGWRGNDHASSLDPDGLKQLVQAVRCVEAALGSPHKTFQLSELPCKSKLGKSVVAARDLAKGTVLRPEQDLSIKVSEPHGAPAKQYYQFQDCVLVTSIKQDEPVTWTQVKKPQVPNLYWDQFLELKNKLKHS